MDPEASIRNQMLAMVEAITPIVQQNEYEYGEQHNLSLV
jgi:hypothetical protein